jgi:nucleotide-binding universal stress UspA family protein
MYKHILIPTDGSELSMKAVEHGVLLARALKARVTSITVISLSTLYQIEPASFPELPEEANGKICEQMPRPGEDSGIGA